MTSWVGSLHRAKILVVKRSLFAVAPLFLFLNGCAKDINNKDAIREAVMTHQSGTPHFDDETIIALHVR